MKKKISEHLAEYMAKHANDEEKLNEFSTWIDEFFEEAEEDYKGVTSAFYEELENLVEEIDEEYVNAVIHKLRHRDGSLSGLKWSMDETNSVAKQYDVESKLKAAGKQFCELKFWFAMNYVFAVHFSVSRTINGYVDLAIDEIANKNVHLDDLIKKIFKKH